jgi:hypothetical protein
VSSEHPLMAQTGRGHAELSAFADDLVDIVRGVTLASSGTQQFGVDPARAAIRFGEEPKAEGAWAGRRLLWLGEKPAFELTYWCGTCPITFERLKGANGTLSVPELEDRLSEGLEGIDADILASFAALLPTDAYLPMLLSVQPRLVTPVGDGDYFANEQVATWGIDGFWGLPENPRTPYYRTFETPVDNGHLYEFVVPMVPPTWNDRARVQRYELALASSSRPTVVAVSTLDISQPATDDESVDYYQHWALTHFVLDGHHKLEAAARTGRVLQLLALVSIGASLAAQEDVLRLPELRARILSSRTTQ